MIPMNDPLLAMVNAARQGKSPLQVLDQLAVRDPRMAQAKRMLQGKDAKQLEQMARNMARERGLDLNQIAQSLGLR